MTTKKKPAKKTAKPKPKAVAEVPKPPKGKSEKIKVIQWDLEKDIYGRPLKQDGAWGPLTQGALDKLINSTEVIDGTIHPVLASSFADPADVAAFKKCKAQGKTDQECFKVGDNGIGCWGDDTTAGSGPSVAFPPETMEEQWGSISNARGQKVNVQANGSGVQCKVKDRMPHRANINNGAGMDMNPDACGALGLRPPVMTKATWEAVT